VKVAGAVGLRLDGERVRHSVVTSGPLGFHPPSSLRPDFICLRRYCLGEFSPHERARRHKALEAQLGSGIGHVSAFGMFGNKQPATIAKCLNDIQRFLVTETRLGMWLVDRWGRRSLMLRLLPVSVVALVVLAFTFTGTSSVAPWLTVVAMVCFMGFNGGSISVTVWLLIAEVFPLNVRTLGGSVGVAVEWLADLVISLIIQALGATGTFLLFGAASVLAIAFVAFFVPETRGRSLEEMESRRVAGDFRKMR
jgi:MFS family permease